MGFLDGYKTYNPEKEGYGDQQQWNRAFFKRMSPDEAWEVLHEQDPYTVLGVTTEATTDEIRKAYYKLAMRWHPDRNPDDIARCEKMMKKINAAYSLIG